MGRFFRTTTPQNVDFMYQLPENLMFKATQQASQDITQNQTAMFSLYDKLKLEALSSDKPRAKQILAGYEDKVNELSQQLQADPLSFRKKNGEITNLARTINKDFTTGEAAAIGGNYQAYVEMLKETNEDVKSKRITDVTSINPFISTQLKNFGNTKFNPVTGDYNRFSPDRLVGTFDLETELAKNAKEMEAQIKSVATAYTKDGYIIEQGGKRTVKTKEDIMQDAMNSISLNQQAMQYLKQRNDIGAMSGWVNEQGGLNVQKNSPFYNLAATIGERFDKDNTEGLYKRMKNDSQTGGPDGTNPRNGIVVDRNNNVINRPTIAGMNPSIIDKTKPDTYPIAQQNRQIAALEENAALTLINAADLIGKFIADNKGLTREKSEYISELAKDGDIDKLKSFAIDNGVTPKIIDEAVNQIETSKREAIIISANRDMFMNQALKSIGLSTSDKLTEGEKKLVIEQANNAMMNSKVNAAKTTSVFQTNGDFFDTKEQRTTFDKVAEKISTDAVEGVLPASRLFVSEVKDDKLTIKSMSNQEFQEYLKLTRSKAKASSTSSAVNPYDLKEKTNTYNPPKKLNVTKVLENINTDSGETMQKPFGIDYGNNLTVYIDASTYPSRDLDATLDANSTNIELKRSIKDINILATAGRASIKENYPDQKFEPFTVPLLSDHMDYTTSVEEDGTSYITFKYDKEVKFGGKMQKRVVLPANDKQSIDEAIRILNKKQ